MRGWTTAGAALSAMLSVTLGLVYIGESVENQAILSNQWGLFAMTDYHRFMPGPLRERLKKLK